MKENEKKIEKAKLPGTTSYQCPLAGFLDPTTDMEIPTHLKLKESISLHPISNA